MVAYDSRRVPDPESMLRPETITALRSALQEQRRAGIEPVTSLSESIRNAAKEARDRNLPPEALLIQLKGLADEVGLPAVSHDRPRRREVREWMVTACLRAYWDDAADKP